METLTLAKIEQEIECIETANQFLTYLRDRVLPHTETNDSLTSAISFGEIWFTQEQIKHVIKTFIVKREEDVDLLIPLINWINKGIVQVKKSGIEGAGWGLFADRDFQRGTKICDYGGYLTNLQEFFDSTKDAFHKSSYYLTDGESGLTGDSRIFFRLDQIGRFPNSVPWKIDKNQPFNNNSILDNETTPLNFIIKTDDKIDIKKGEEIFVGYGGGYGWNLVLPHVSDKQFKKWLKDDYEPHLPQLKEPYQLKNLEQWYDLTEEEQTEILTHVRRTLESYHGTLRQWKIYFEQLRDLLPFNDTLLLFHYRIHTEDEANSPELREILEDNPHFIAPGTPTLIKNDKVVARNKITVGDVITTMGGPVTNMDVFGSCDYPSIRLKGWYLYPHRMFRMIDIGNLIEQTDDQTISNCRLSLDKQDWIVRVISTSNIERGSTLKLYVPLREKDKCGVCQIKKVKLMDRITGLLVCSEECWKKTIKC